MKTLMRISVLAACLLIFSAGIYGQSTPKLEVTPLENPADIQNLVRNIMAGGGFDTIYGINYEGNYNGIGTFINGDEIDVPTGVIISNGHVKSAEGYNVTGAQYLEQDWLIPDTSQGGGGVGGGTGGNDPDLAKLNGIICGSNKPIRVFDASVLSFYVRPYGDVISLKYIFASEEYTYYAAGGSKPDFVAIDSLPQDVFGIFFWAQPTNKKVISVVQGGPGDWHPISLKDIHPGMNPNFGNIYEQNPPTPPFTPVYSIEFDGFVKQVDSDSPMQTVIWDTMLQVVPCQTYGIKIGVADAWYQGSYNGNPYSVFFNSAVFLPEGGMIGSGSGLEWSLKFESDNNDFGTKEMVEGGCSRMIVTMKKTERTLDTLWIRYKLVNADTSEYTITPAPKQDSLIGIPPLDSMATYIIEAKFDGIAEGTGGKERWWFRYQEDPCDIPYNGWGTQHQGYSGVDTLWVYDYTPIVGGSKTYGPVPNTTYHCGNQVTLNVEEMVQGGIPPYFYSWIQDPPGGGTGLGPNFTITISDNPDHSVCYTRDRCTDFAIYQQGLYDVNVLSELTAEASPDFQLCENLEWPITITQTNVDQDFTVEWYFQGGLVSTNKIYVVKWDDYFQYYQVIDPLVFDYIVRDDCGNEVTGHVDAYWDPVVDISGPDVICLDESITLSCTEGKPGTPYKWYKDSVAPGNLIATTTVNELTQTPSAAAIYTVCVEITNACDQIATSCFTYEVSELVCAVEMNAGGPFSVCPLTPFTLEELNGTSEWNWTWVDNFQTQTATGQSITVTLITPGTHQFTVSAYNEHGCYDDLTFTVTVFPYTTASAASELPEVCEGFPIWVRAESAVQAASYHWTSDPPDINLSNPDAQQTTVAPFQPTTYTCLVTDINGCTDEAVVFVDIREPIQGFVSADPLLICNGQPATIEFTGNTLPGISQYTWTFEGGDPPAGDQQTHTVTWNTAGTFDITLHIDEPGCEADFTYPITIEPLPVPMMSANNNRGCQPVTVQFQDQSQNLVGPTYLWDFGDGTTSDLANPDHTYPNPGTYDVTLTIVNSTGCEQTSTFPGAVEVYPLPDALFEADPPAATLDNPKILFLSGTTASGNDHTWDFGDGTPQSNEVNPIHTYSAVGTYTVLHTIENQYGCLDIDTLEVGISKELKIFIPNTFTPNGDGLNDCFAVSGTVSDIVDRFSVLIYDKWGQTVYDDIIRSYDCIWDGKGPDGKMLEGGEYVYVVSGKDLQGKKHVYQGVVIVLR